MSDAAWVDTDDAFADLVADLRTADAYAVDTEFHRERTYFPRVALVQIAWNEHLALVDPLAVSLQPLAEVLDGPGLAVMHAAAQDLEVLELSCGTIPARLFDTQLAGGFLGFGTPSLAALVEGELGIRLPKGDRLTDWLRRPLDEAQRSYAASDVLYLLELHRRLAGRLADLGREQWCADECEALRVRFRGPRDPDEAWQRIKEARHLKGKALGVARAVAAWRERRAASLDQPVRHVLPDLAVVGIAQRAPTSADQFKGIRGLDERQARGTIGKELLAAVADGLQHPVDRADRPASNEIDRSLRPAVTLVSAWVSQLARELRIETSLLAARADIESFLADDPSSRLSSGWRHDLVGEPIRKVVAGEAALAFDGKGGLVLEQRSHQPVQHLG